MLVLKKVRLNKPYFQLQPIRAIAYNSHVVLCLYFRQPNAVQVHAGTLNPALLASLSSDQVDFSGVVYKVQHTDMQRLMDSDIRWEFLLARA